MAVKWVGGLIKRGESKRLVGVVVGRGGAVEDGGRNGKRRIETLDFGFAFWWFVGVVLKGGAGLIVDILVGVVFGWGWGLVEAGEAEVGMDWGDGDGGQIVKL